MGAGAARGLARGRAALPIRAYALSLRNQRGDRDLAAALAVLGNIPLAEHSLETLGWLLPVLKDSDEAAAILRHLVRTVSETAGAAHFVDRVDERGDLYLRSGERADGILLDALVDAAPRSDLVNKLARGVLAHRRSGRWGNTQENAFNLLALRRYFAAYEQTRPDFVARAWLGDKAAGEHAFTGRTNEQHRVFVPMQALLAEGAKDLVLAKTGPGRLYYRIGLRHVAAEPDRLAADHGFAVARAYAGVDDPDDVRRDPDGTWRIRAGARVRVDLMLSTDAERYHVVLVDPLPAGLEALSPALDRRGEVDDGQVRRSAWRWWFDHDNLRDDRAEAFTASLAKGIHAYSYMARATTQGTFTAPPTRAEEMYAPETHGRGATDRVIVE